jgi:hypothetical protein
MDVEWSLYVIYLCKLFWASYIISKWMWNDRPSLPKYITYIDHFTSIYLLCMIDVCDIFRQTFWGHHTQSVNGCRMIDVRDIFMQTFFGASYIISKWMWNDRPSLPKYITYIDNFTSIYWLCMISTWYIYANFFGGIIHNR